MITKEIAKKVFDEALSTGADFAELFCEDTYENSIQMLSGKIENASTKHKYGVGLRVLLDLQELYGYTSAANFLRSLFLNVSTSKFPPIVPPLD